MGHPEELEDDPPLATHGGQGRVLLEGVLLGQLLERLEVRRWRMHHAISREEEEMAGVSCDHGVRLHVVVGDPYGW